MVICSMILAVACAAEPKTEVYRLERNPETEAVAVVGQDGVRRHVCLVDPAEYAVITGQVMKLWNAMHQQTDSRARLHGGRPKKVLDEANKELVYTYPDGFVYRDKAEALSRGATRRKINGTKRPTAEPRSSVISPRLRKSMSDRQRKFLEGLEQRLEERKGREPKTVTIEHDAVTGKDREVK